MEDKKPPLDATRRLDPLILLRDATKEQKRVTISQEYLNINGYKVHRSTRCAYRRAPGEPFLDIGSVWYMYHEASKEDGHYSKETARKHGYQYLDLFARSELLSYLEGSTNACENIVEDVLYGRKRPKEERMKGLPEPPRAKRPRVDGQPPPKADRKRSAQEVDKEQLSYAEFIKRARPMKGVEHIVRTPGRELPNISPLLKLAQYELLHWNEPARPVAPPTRVRRPFIQELEEILKNSPKDRPIILVPMNKNAPINLLNVYQFLQEGTYTPPERSGASTFEFESMRKEFVEVARIIDGKRWTFEVRDSTKGFTKGQWKRVVAVVTDGADWQFKDWPFETIVDLFCTIKGIYFREKDKQVEVPEHVTKWRVRIMDLASTHLQHRFQALKDAFWKEVEGFMKSERIHRFSNTASLDGRRAASEVKMRKPIL